MTYSRHDVWALQDDTLAEYANAVAAMRARGKDDPTSWTFQAAMHGSYQRPGTWPFNQCKHFSWWFLPWHRMYIWYFEQIVRAAVISTGGSSDWALPYWNYGAGGQEATLPLAFRGPQAGGPANPLYEAQRAAAMNDGTGSIPPHIGYPAQALACRSFVGSYQAPPPEFGGSPADPSLQFANVMGVLENTPHNQVHNLVGGRHGLMTDPDTAAEDPIFWLHHSNIDRIWDEWARVPHQDPADPDWLSHPFKFYDAQGNEVSLTCAEVRDIAAQPLDYEYVMPTPRAAGAPAVPRGPSIPAFKAAAEMTDVTGEPRSRKPAELVGASEAPVQLSGTPVDVGVRIDRRAAESALSAAGVRQPSHVYLSVQEVEGEKDPGTVYGIYVNLPDAQAEPEVVAAHYAGAISFFGIARATAPRSDEPPHTVAVTHEITALTHELESQGQWDGEHVTVSFRPTGLVPPDRPEMAHALPTELSSDDPPITIGRVSIFYE